MAGKKEGWMVGWLAGWLDGWMDGWLVGWMQANNRLNKELEIAFIPKQKEVGRHPLPPLKKLQSEPQHHAIAYKMMLCAHALAAS